jgi:translation initiation factor 2 alpha subunit (eIF-2alpha)
MVGRPQILTDGQRKQVTKILWKQILTVSLIGLALLGGIMGYSLREIYQRLEHKLETLVAKQFEEPRIQEVLTNVAETKAEALLIEHINPVVEKFMAEISNKLQVMEQNLTAMESITSKSNSNARQIEKILSSAQKSEQEVNKFKETISGLQSDLVKINRGLVEIQYFTVKGANTFPNPYRDRIQKTLNEIAEIAIPNSQERAKFVQEMNAYKPK